MPLTPENLTTLKRAFAEADHEFINGFVYLSEEAICDRIETVDPSWSFDIIRFYREGDQSICAARMTICGVSRDCVGMQKVIERAGEPEKGAATDALKRGARLFGIGRYLLGAPKESQGFNTWLAKQQAANPTPAAPALTVVSGGKAAPTRSDDLLQQMESERSEAITTAVSGDGFDGSFLCDRIERKEKDGKRWLVFHAAEPSKEYAIAWARSEVAGLRDSILSEHYNLLEQVGTVFIGELTVCWKTEVKGDKTNRRVISAAIPDAVSA